MMNSTNSTSIRPWQFFLTASLIGAAVLVWMAPPAPPIALAVLSLGVVAAGACAVAVHSVLGALTGARGTDGSVTASQREGLEREKLLTLRAIKDLEFDKAMRKISDADAAPMERRLRDRAMAIMRELDGREALRGRIERDYEQRQATGQRPEASGPDAAMAFLCPACATVNDPDARFCKGCGAKL